MTSTPPAPKVSARELLDWYDRNARELPWRLRPGSDQTPDPYLIWLSEIMLQQTVVAAVIPYFQDFTSRWPDVHALAAANDADVMAAWAGLGYYARARNLLKCARVICRDYGGRFPNDHAALLKLPGIGPYTAAAISAIAFQRPETVVDGNVERVMARVHACADPLPGVKPQLSALASTLTPTKRPGDYAQAVMDLGATICTPKSPSCGICPWAKGCLARKAGIAATLPAKSPKFAKPVRFGIVYLAQRTDGAWLVERRPAKGLLGGMLGWPGSIWSGEPPADQPPLAADWQSLADEVRHTFTHFHLRLEVRIATGLSNQTPDRGFFLPAEDFRRADLPTVMRKAFDLATKEASSALSEPDSVV